MYGSTFNVGMGRLKMHFGHIYLRYGSISLRTTAKWDKKFKLQKEFGVSCSWPGQEVDNQRINTILEDLPEELPEGEKANIVKCQFTTLSRNSVYMINHVCVSLITLNKNACLLLQQMERVY